MELAILIGEPYWLPEPEFTPRILGKCQLTFSLDDLLVIGVIGSQEGDGSSRVEGLLQFVIYLPSVIALLHQDEGC